MALVLCQAHTVAWYTPWVHYPAPGVALAVADAVLRRTGTALWAQWPCFLPGHGYLRGHFPVVVPVSSVNVTR